MKNAIEIVKHEEYVIKMGEDRISLGRDEALKLYNELQDVLGLEVPVLEEIIYTPPVYPCPYIPYTPYPSPWGVDPHPYYHYDYYGYNYNTYVTCGTSGTSDLRASITFTNTTDENEYYGKG